MDIIEKQKQKFYEIIYKILLKYPKGITEYDLLQLLKNKKIPLIIPEKMHDPLILFQTHFILFHLLYSLRDYLLKTKKNDLDIHCLKIILTPFIEIDSTLPAVTDKLRSYYINLKNANDIDREKVKSMLTEFWQNFEKYSKRPEALEIFCLNDPVSDNVIKKRYHELALKHHPDHGGDPDVFKKIRDAASILLEQK